MNQPDGGGHGLPSYNADDSENIENIERPPVTFGATQQAATLPFASSLTSPGVWLSKSWSLLASNIGAVAFFYILFPITLTVLSGLLIYVSYGSVGSAATVFDLQGFGHGEFGTFGDEWVLAFLAAGIFGALALAAANLGGLHYLHGAALDQGRNIGQSYLVGLKRLPRYIGNSIVVGLIGVVALIGFGLVIAIAGLAGAPVGFLILVGAIAIPFMIYFLVKTSFVDLASAVSSPRSLALQVSWELSKGHFWDVFLRLFAVGVAGWVLAFIAGGTNAAIPFEVFDMLDIEPFMDQTFGLSGRATFRDRGFGDTSFVLWLLLAQLITQLAWSISGALSAVSRTTMFVDVHTERSAKTAFAQPQPLSYPQTPAEDPFTTSLNAD